MGRVDEALRRFRAERAAAGEGQAELLDSLERPDSTLFPPPHMFESPWQFAPADERPGASAGTSELGLELAESLIPAAVAPDGLDSVSCALGLDCRFRMDVWPPGTEPAGYPQMIDRAAFVAHAGGVCVSPPADLGEAGADLAAAGQAAGEALGQPGTWQPHEVQIRLARRIGAGQEAPLALTQAVFEELFAAVGAARGRLVVKTPDVTQPVALAAVGSWLTTMPLPDLEPIRTAFSPDLIVTTAQLTGGGTAGAEFHSVDRIPFTYRQALIAEAGMTLLGIWLSGVTSTTAGRLAERVGGSRPAPAPDAAAGAEMERVKRLSLKGGVLVARFSDGAPPGAWAVTSVIEAMRKELRSSDLLGQLPTGEITALLVRASAEGVVAVAWRVKERLEALAREHQLPPIELGHALYPDGGAESLSALVERARPTA